MKGVSVPYRPTAIDLFSGCGGLTLGLKQAQFKVLAAIECEDKARRVYAANHPEVLLFDKDIRMVQPSEVLHSLSLEPGDLDLLAGCPPCQGFSRIRLLNTSKLRRDKRNTLIDEFARFVADLHPKFVMMENVPGLAAYYRFQKFVRSLRRTGYQVKVEVLDASGFGVPQRRKRLVLLASRVGVPSFASPSANIRTVRQAIGLMGPAGISGDPLHDLPERRAERVRNLMQMIPKDGGSRSDLPASMQLDCHTRMDGFHDIYGRMAWDTVAPTITSGCINPSKGRFLHPSEDRTITLREAALLQGFPSNYSFDTRLGKEALALMIGNALPPPFIAAHARKIASDSVLVASVEQNR